MVNINTNIGSLMAAKGMKVVQRNVDTASLRLSTGLRVNFSADDAAGLAVSNKMVSQIRGMEVALKNTSDGISLLQTAIAGMQNSLDIAQRMRELAIQSHNGVYVYEERLNLQQEVDELLGELNRIATHTKFNDVNLLDGTYDKDIRVGNTNPEIVRVTIDGMGINKHVEGESYATGHATQILSPIEYAIGTSEFGTPNTSYASGETDPRYLASATASGTSEFNLPANSQSTLISSSPSYLLEDLATGTSSFNIPAQSSASGVSTPFYHTFTNAEIRTGSISKTSTFTEVGFNNGDFSEGEATQNGNVVSIPGWDIYLENAFLDGRPFEIAGHQAPLDTSYPPSFTQEVTHLENEMRTQDINNFVQNGELVLDQKNQNSGLYASTGPGFHIARGPYVVSQAGVSLEAGDSVSFEWFGMAGGDAYDVYAYLVEETTGATVNLINASSPNSGTSTAQDGLGVNGWITQETTVNTAGSYKFVFIAGTFDRTGFRYSGNGLKIRNIDVTQANPPVQNEYKAAVTVQAVESDEVRISGTLLGSAELSKQTDPGGIYSILPTGVDFGKFNIDPLNGDIVSNQPLRYNDKNTYKFDIEYTGPNGVSHVENVTLRLTPHDEAYSQLTVQESNEVLIDPAALTSFQNFIDFENQRNAGQVLEFTLSAYSDNDGNPLNNGQLSDFTRFSIDPITGLIRSNGPLDFSLDSDYHFDITARAADGREFVNHVILNLEDTFSSTANFEVEETNRIKINLADLTASADFAQRYAGGTFSIPNSGLDNDIFSIVGNEIIANENFRIPNKGTYQFQLNYTDGVVQHTETVSINLTRFLQADSTLTALEAEQVGLSIDDLTHISNFASDDNYAGTFRLERYDNNDGNPANDGDADDVNEFYIANGTREIFSYNPLDFTAEDTFHFNVVYTASNGTEFKDRVILSLQDTLGSTAYLRVEEADQIIINIADLTATNTYSTLNPGGDFSIGLGSELFQIQGNQIVANKEFRKEDQGQYELELIYTHNGIQHVEQITVELTRFLQSQGTFTALEANTVNLSRDALTHLNDFANDNPGGSYSLSGPDANLFNVNSSGSIYSLNTLDFDTQQNYRVNLDYISDAGTFSSELTLNIQDTLSGQANLSCEEAQSIIVSGNLLQSLQAYAAKDGNQGSFELLEQGDHDLFTIAADGTLTSKGEVRMATKPVLDLFIQYSSNTIDNFVEHIQIALTPTSYDHSRSEFIAKESSEVIIVPQINQFLAAYAAEDNYAGRFEISQSPYTNQPDYNFFNIDSTGKISSKGQIDFEEDQREFEITVYYHHSSGQKKYTDFRRLDITNDKRDDNNLALEDLDITTRANAAEAAELLNKIIVRITASQAKLGAIQNRFTHNIENLNMNIMMANQANGRIIDADYAKESTYLARSQILEQAATDMLVKANQAKQNLLILLQ